VIVTETTMPGIDGFALCASLRRKPVTANVHIVVASASPAAWSRAFVAGADRVLIKPYPIEELIAAVRDVLLQVKTPPH
jgi:DNA-binding response OmpR family regulator